MLVKLYAGQPLILLRPSKTSSPDNTDYGFSGETGLLQNRSNKLF